MYVMLVLASVISRNVSLSYEPLCVQMGSPCSGTGRQAIGLERLRATKELCGQPALILLQCVAPLHLLTSARESSSCLCWCKMLILLVKDRVYICHLGDINAAIVQE